MKIMFYHFSTIWLRRQVVFTIKVVKPKINHSTSQRRFVWERNFATSPFFGGRKGAGRIFASKCPKWSEFLKWKYSKWNSSENECFCRVFPPVNEKIRFDSQGMSSTPWISFSSTARWSEAMPWQFVLVVVTKTGCHFGLERCNNVEIVLKQGLDKRSSKKDSIQGFSVERNSGWVAVVTSVQAKTLEGI